MGWDYVESTDGLLPRLAFDLIAFSPNAGCASVTNQALEGNDGSERSREEASSRIRNNTRHSERGRV